MTSCHLLLKHIMTITEVVHELIQVNDTIVWHSDIVATFGQPFLATKSELPLYPT